MGSLEDSIPESERPVFGFTHKIRSPPTNREPDRIPESCLDSSFEARLASEGEASSGTPGTARATYTLSAGVTPVVAAGAAAGQANKRTSGDSASSGQFSFLPGETLGFL